MKTVERGQNVVGMNLQQIKVSVNDNSLVYFELWFKFFLTDYTGVLGYDYAGSFGKQYNLPWF